MNEHLYSLKHVVDEHIYQHFLNIFFNVLHPC